MKVVCHNTGPCNMLPKGGEGSAAASSWIAPALSFVGTCVLVSASAIRWLIPGPFASSSHESGRDRARRGRPPRTSSHPKDTKYAVRRRVIRAVNPIVAKSRSDAEDPHPGADGIVA